MAEIFKRELRDTLIHVQLNGTEETEYPSPEQLKYRVIIKHKKLKTQSEDEEIEGRAGDEDGAYSLDDSIKIGKLVVKGKDGSWGDHLFVINATTLSWMPDEVARERAAAGQVSLVSPAHLHVPRARMVCVCVHRACRRAGELELTSTHDSFWAGVLLSCYLVNILGRGRERGRGARPGHGRRQPGEHRGRGQQEHGRARQTAPKQRKPSVARFLDSVGSSARTNAPRARMGVGASYVRMG